MAENVKVAVRVRPFNKREKARNATLIVEMNGATTKLINPEAPNEEPKSFTFDYSYWSHDGFAEDETGYLGGTQPNYADQRRVYDDVGQTVLNNAWEGYNSTLFAYGQTGSGKSWSIVGYGVNKGIVPIFCDELFKGIHKKKDEGDTSQYEVLFSMLEIYNEQVRDLLNPSSNKKGGLKIRQHPKKGFYADGLKTVPVTSYQQIEDKMDEGTENRTVAATNMNATSSRAHTIVGVTFTQKCKNAAGEETAKTSLINLVDLAGSERADSTGATGDRLKEGAAINQSLSALGNVISALVDKANGKNVRVPYRDSALTRLLKNALAGNSKTAMIAAISPADINYDETLSTLRYADRAKQIKTTATVNEDPTEKLIRELQEQNEKLLEKLKAVESGQKIKIDDDDDDDDDDDGKLSDEEMAALRKQIEEDIRASMANTDQAVADMNKTWDERVAETDQSSRDKEALKKERMETPHFWNLNPDSQLTGMIVHLLKKEKVTIGNKKADPPADIQLAGLNIQKEHCVIDIVGDKINITPIGDAKLLINGEPITEEEELEHHDRVMFGSNHLYVFHHPKQADKATIKAEAITYEMAQEEIAQNSGFDMAESNSRDAMLLQGDLVDLVPMVEEANAISMELDRKVSFEVVVMTAKARGLSEGSTEPYVLMRNLDTGLEWLWPKQKFINRKYLMQEMYSNYEDDEDWQLPDERDPFTESPDEDFMVGCVEVSMESLGYVLDMREQLNITDSRGREVGFLNVEVVPLDNKGKEITEETDLFIDNPRDLIGQKLNFVVRITSARGLPKKYTDVYCSYKLFLDDDPKTEKVSGTANPDFNYERKFHFDPVDEQFVNYLMKKSVIIQVWGKQIPDTKTSKAAKDTKAIMKKENMKKGMAKGNKNVPAMMSLTDHLTTKKRAERLELQINQLRKLCDKREMHGHIAVAIKDVRHIIGDTKGNTAPSGGNAAATPTGKQTTEQRRTESSACTIL